MKVGASLWLGLGLVLTPSPTCRYAAPEQYIMSTQTPSAPSAPVATALSPVLWQVSWLAADIPRQRERERESDLLISI